MGLNFSDWCSYQKKMWGEMQRKMQCEERDRDCPYSATSQDHQGLLAMTRSCKRQRGILHQRLHRERGPADNLISDLEPPEL